MRAFGYSRVGSCSLSGHIFSLGPPSVLRRDTSIITSPAAGGRAPDDLGDSGQSLRERQDGSQVTQQTVGLDQCRPAHQNPGQPPRRIVPCAGPDGPAARD
jgi:hypothetical protein